MKLRKLRNHFGNFVPALLLLGLASGGIIVSSVVEPTRDAGAVSPTTVSTEVSRVGFGLSIETDPQIILNVQPTSTGAMTVGSAVVIPGTTSPSGYTLYLQMTGANADTNALINSTDSSATITSSGTFTNPVALTAGKWGYAIPGNTTSLLANGFDAAYSTMESATPTASKFAAVPTYPGDAQKIAETNAPGGYELNVFYGVMANYNTISGTYSNKILYTALADNGSEPTMIVSPTRIAGGGNVPMQLMTSLYTTVEDIDYAAYLLTPDQYSQVEAGTLDLSTLTAQKLTGCTRDMTADSLTVNCKSVAMNHAGPTIVYLDVPTYDTHYATQIMMAGTEEFYTIKNMQEMTAGVCASVPTPAAGADYAPTTYLNDTRDGNTYEVKKLADGNCWMTQNLALAGETIDYTNSNLPAGVTYNVPASSTDGWCTSSAEACINTGNVLDARDDEHPEYGMFYSWAAATAGYGTYSNTSVSSYSICPKGWRLPSGGASGEFQGLINAGYSTVDLLMDEAGPNFAMSGYRSGGNTKSQGRNSFNWSNTASDRTLAYYLGFNVPNIYNNAYYKYYGLPVRCVANSFWNIADMQEIDKSMIKQFATLPAASATENKTTKAEYEAVSDKSTAVPMRTLKDTRDDRTYDVKLLADGNIWMTQNLRLISTSDIQIKPVESDVTTNFTLRASDSGTWCTAQTAECYNQSMALDSGRDDYGAYYNWYAATAGTGTYEVSSGNASSSICPKGWRLPTGGHGGEFVQLYIKYNDSENLLRNSPNFVYAGNVSGKKIVGLDYYTRYYSSSAYSNAQANAAYLSASEIGSYHRTTKDTGASVRCIAK